MLVGAVILIVLVGLRYRVGCDWQTYQDLFDYSEYSSFSTAIGLSDPAFGALNWLVIPWALLGLFFGVLSRGTAGRNLNLILLIVAVIRLWLGGGLF